MFSMCISKHGQTACQKFHNQCTLGLGHLLLHRQLSSGPRTHFLQPGVIPRQLLPVLQLSRQSQFTQLRRWPVTRSLHVSRCLNSGVGGTGGQPQRPVQPKAGLVKLDHEPGLGHLVYEGPLSALSRGIKLFSVSNSTMFLAVQPFVLQAVMSWSPLVQAGYASAFFFFTFAQTAFIHVMTSRYVTKLWYDYGTGQFTANLMNLVGVERAWQFRAADVELANSPLASLRVRAVRRDTGRAAVRSVLMDARAFMDRDAYLALMGYDKPMDIRTEAAVEAEDEAEFRAEWTRKAAEFDRVVAAEEADPFRAELEKVRRDMERDMEHGGPAEEVNVGGGKGQSPPAVEGVDVGGGGGRSPQAEEEVDVGCGGPAEEERLRKHA